MIQLRPITIEDIAEIKKWPSYRNGFKQMDYALRNGGWLDEFWNRSDSWIFITEFNNAIIGFSLLSLTANKEAEFRIAIHPDWLGKGLGKQVTLATLEKGFGQLTLEKIHLIVRKNNPRASKLYKSLGFSKTGESIHAIHGRRIEFIDMLITKAQFNNH